MPDHSTCFALLLTQKWKMRWFRGFPKIRGDHFGDLHNKLGEAYHWEEVIEERSQVFCEEVQWLRV